MISTSQPRRSRTFELAVAISLLVHVLTMLIYVGLASRYFSQIQRLAQKQEDLAATTDFVRIEKKTIPREAQQLSQTRSKPVVVRPAVPAAAPPAVVHQPLAAPKPVERHELARLSPEAPAQPQAATKPVPSQPSQVRAPTQTAPQPRTANGFSQEQLAALDQRFENAIAQSKSDLLNNPPPKERPVATRRYDSVMLGTPQDLQRVEGWVEYHEDCPGRPHCYFLRVFITWPDGYSETVDIPWAYHFTDRFDPIEETERAGYGRVVFAAQDPPPGFQLPHPFQLSRLLCMYFRSECEAVLDAEHGGTPATN